MHIREAISFWKSKEIKPEKNQFGDLLSSSFRERVRRKFAGQNSNHMATTTPLPQSLANNYTEEVSSVSLVKRFFDWCKGQEENRLLWLGVALAGHGCIITPLTVMAVLLAGTNMFLFILAIVAMGMALVTNLAAMPTRITLPVLFLSILIDLAIVISCIAIGFDITTTYI